MKTIHSISLSLAILVVLSSLATDRQSANQVHQQNSGLILLGNSSEKVVLHFSTNDFLHQITSNGNSQSSVSHNQSILLSLNDFYGLPGLSTMVAIPQGAAVKLRMLEQITTTHQNIIIENTIAHFNGDFYVAGSHETKQDLFGSDFLFHDQPVTVSEKTLMRGVDVVIVSIFPFRYDSLTRELLEFSRLEFDLEFHGGNGHFGDDRLRNHWFDPILAKNLINFRSLPVLNYDRSYDGDSKPIGADYLIICPNDDVFQQWADSLRRFRTLQGYLTKVVTLSEIGGNSVSQIENYINNAYSSWIVAPFAVLCLGDHGTNAANSIPAPIWDNYCASDNIYADVDGNHLPDLIIGRITAKNGTQLESIISKIIHYERFPPADSSFYQHPITSCEFIVTSTNQLTTETIAGYLENYQGKTPNRLNVGPNPIPNTWCTNNQAFINMYGPFGLGYVPFSPGQLNCTWNATAQDFIEGINNGSFMLLHQGYSDINGWQAPVFESNDISNLTNTDPVFVWSNDNLSGKFNLSEDCFAERFLSHTCNEEPSGALCVIAASENVYNDIVNTFAMGTFDCLFDDFHPMFGSTFGYRVLMPAAANASGKHFLQQSSWPPNPVHKQTVIHAFNYFGDPLTTLYTEVPQQLTVSHNPWILEGSTVFQISANAGTLIALSVNGELIAVTGGNGLNNNINIPPQYYPDKILVTVTKPNFYPYQAEVHVILEALTAGFSSDNQLITEGDTIRFYDQSTGLITERTWIFEGGTPAISNELNPLVVYNNSGSFDVTLIIANNTYSDTITLADYITVFPALPGDANCDGNVNVLDVISIVSYLMGMNPQPFSFTNADLNNDGVINVLDVIGIVNIITGAKVFNQSKPKNSS